MRAMGLRSIFAAPLAIAALSLFGLVAALIGDGMWDTVGALALAAPVVITAWAYTRSRQG